MECTHDCYRDICTQYDRRSAVLVYFWTCEGCGTRLGEVARERYQPNFEPGGNELAGSAGV
jgi:hypothetical protein